VRLTDQQIEKWIDKWVSYTRRIYL
jgi:hypothetical protein